ncbi:ROK family transcriptional regulator [Isoptericola sp. b441]|uniref:ROK family transcriptional regulator n=1 Tax=Actinotalea lenta TaxID=3064654 RepID=A0ABT9D646_9CELL|nr:MULTISPECIES: ROK family transcriptional regulator [unclassified Isoptericola]MDO8105609.1 ROK family transcriptional regulator [Isoptericola sp. b441]MDO8122729.1 ROK family transcriptional regulator [Isoptericola sp. b490]
MAGERASGGSQTSLREANRARIIGAVQHRGSITQIELAGVTGLSTATVSNIVKELVAAGVLQTSPTSRSGRRAQEVSLARNLGLVVGVDVGEREMRVAIADVALKVVAEQRLPLPPGHRADSGLDRAALLVEELVESVGAPIGEVLAVGVGLPAPVDPRTGVVTAPHILPGWAGADVAAVLGDRLHVPVVVDNSANLGALAETRLGAARGMTNVAWVTLAHGVGMGLVVEGRVVHGRRGAAGEIGHVIDVEDGPECRCGLHGCLEGSIGSAALAARLAPTHGHLALRDIVGRALAGDAACTRVVGDAGRRLGRSLAPVLTVLDPDVVVVDGDLAGAGEVMLTPLREELNARTVPIDPGPVPVEVSALAGQARVRGALVVALDEHQVGIPIGALT